MSEYYADVVIVGAGAAGLFCAIEAGKRGRRVMVVDHANKPGKKILMSGGGRCNFTNRVVRPEHFISHNPHFCKSALSRYTSQHFIEFVAAHQIPYHEKTLGQLFCDHKSRDILEALLADCARWGVEIFLNTTIDNIETIKDHHFKLTSQRGTFHSESLVIATGGLSIPTMGSSAFGLQVAEQFGLHTWPTRAGLVPLVWSDEDKQQFSPLAGIALGSVVQSGKVNFRENLLFTHVGLSGPAVLQISSYWLPGQATMIDLFPDNDALSCFLAHKRNTPKKSLKNMLHAYFPKRFVENFFSDFVIDQEMQALTDAELKRMASRLHAWTICPAETEGYRTAEVMLGGVDCDALSSKTMEANAVPGLYFIGEVVDVTGWLGGFNFQWAWSSGWAAGQVV